MRSAAAARFAYTETTAAGPRILRSSVQEKNMWNFRFWRRKNKTVEPPLLEQKNPAASDEEIIDYQGRIIEIDPEEKIAAMENDRMTSESDLTEFREAEDGTDSRREENSAGDQEEERTLYNWTSSGKKKKKKSKKKGRSVSANPAGDKAIVAVGDLRIGDGIPKICVPVTGRTKTDILNQTRALLPAKPDLVEWRVDYLPDLFVKSDDEGTVCVAPGISDILDEMAGILGAIPILFTFRTRREGGEQELNGEKYVTLLKWAAEQEDVKIIDVEARKPDVDAEILVKDIHAQGCKVIASSHNFAKTPKRSELHRIFDLLDRTGADVLKVAVMPKNRKDVMKLIDVTFEEQETRTCPIVTMSMGDLGRISRISGGLTGSAVTFGTVGDASAPGQLSVQDLRYIFARI